MTVSKPTSIIGAGAGGLSVAAGAAPMGARVVLEGHKMGGDCLNYGCVPSKALIAAGKQAAMGAGQGLGVAPVMAQVDYGMPRIMFTQAIATIAPQQPGRFEGFGIKVIREYGRFIRKPKCSRYGHHRTTLVIATGSARLPQIRLDALPHYTNETSLSAHAAHASDHYRRRRDWLEWRKPISALAAG